MSFLQSVKGIHGDPKNKIGETTLKVKLYLCPLWNSLAG